MSGVWRFTRLCLPIRFDPGQRRTGGQGVHQSTSPLQGVTEGWERKRRRRSQREIGDESLIIIVTVSHTLATQCQRQSVLALGVWRVTLSFHPSLPSAYTHVFLSHSQQPILFIFAKGIFVMLSSSPPFLTVQSYWSRPEALGCPLFCSSPVATLSSGQGHIPVAAVKSSEKLWHKAGNLSLINDWWANADSSHRRKKPIFWPKT